MKIRLLSLATFLEEMTMQEQIDCIVVDSDFQLAAAIKSLEFFWSLAKKKDEAFSCELRAERGAIVSPREVAWVKPEGGDL